MSSSRVASLEPSESATSFVATAADVGCDAPVVRDGAVQVIPACSPCERIIPQRPPWCDFAHLSISKYRKAETYCALFRSDMHTCIVRSSQNPYLPTHTCHLTWQQGGYLRLYTATPNRSATALCLRATHVIVLYEARLPCLFLLAVECACSHSTQPSPSPTEGTRRHLVVWSIYAS